MDRCHDYASGIHHRHVAFFLDLAWLVWASAGSLLVGALIGWMMAKLGYGVDATRSAHESH